MTQICKEKLINDIKKYKAMVDKKCLNRFLKTAFDEYMLDIIDIIDEQKELLPVDLQLKKIIDDIAEDNKKLEEENVDLYIENKAFFRSNNELYRQLRKQKEYIAKLEDKIEELKEKCHKNAIHMPFETGGVECIYEEVYMD